MSGVARAARAWVQRSCSRAGAAGEARERRRPVGCQARPGGRVSDAVPVSRSIAAELVRLSGDGSGSSGSSARGVGHSYAGAQAPPQAARAGATGPNAGAAAAAPAGGAPVAGMQAQLADLLRRRSAADAQALAARKAEIAEGLFRQERERAQELQAQARRPGRPAQRSARPFERRPPWRRQRGRPARARAC